MAERKKRLCQHGKPYRARLIIDMVWCSDKCELDVLSQEVRFLQAAIRRIRARSKAEAAR